MHPRSAISGNISLECRTSIRIVATVGAAAATDRYLLVNLHLSNTAICDHCSIKNNDHSGGKADAQLFLRGWLRSSRRSSTAIILLVQVPVRQLQKNNFLKTDGICRYAYGVAHGLFRIFLGIHFLERPYLSWIEAVSE